MIKVNCQWEDGSEDEMKLGPDGVLCLVDSDSSSLIRALVPAFEGHKEKRLRPRAFLPAACLKYLYNGPHVLGRKEETLIWWGTYSKNVTRKRKEEYKTPFWAYVPKQETATANVKAVDVAEQEEQLSSHGMLKCGDFHTHPWAGAPSASATDMTDMKAHRASVCGIGSSLGDIVWYSCFKGLVEETARLDVWHLKPKPIEIYTFDGKPVEEQYRPWPHQHTFAHYNKSYGKNVGRGYSFEDHFGIGNSYRDYEFRNEYSGALDMEFRGIGGSTNSEITLSIEKTLIANQDRNGIRVTFKNANYQRVTVTVKISLLKQLIERGAVELLVEGRK